MGMRAALWFVGLFALAVAVALWADNGAVVSIFWSPWRTDVGLNLALATLAAVFVVLHLAWRGIAALMRMPQQTRQRRIQQRVADIERALARGYIHWAAGRFARSRKSAQTALAGCDQLQAMGYAHSQDQDVRVWAHLLAAESAHAMQDASSRDGHLAQLHALLDAQPQNAATEEMREATQLRAARWALDERDPLLALERLSTLGAGAARRLLALRVKLKASRLAGHSGTALETARLLAKHGGFSAQAATSVVRSLLLQNLRESTSVEQLIAAHALMDEAQKADFSLACPAAQRLMELQGDAALARQWLHAAWVGHFVEPTTREQAQTQMSSPATMALIDAVRTCLSGAQHDWLALIEQTTRTHPHLPQLQYLAGLVCLERQLWGKARQQLEKALPRLQHRAWRVHAMTALAALAEQREDAATAAQLYRRAALEATQQPGADSSGKGLKHSPST